MELLIKIFAIIGILTTTSFVIMSLFVVNLYITGVEEDIDLVEENTFE